MEMEEKMTVGKRLRDLRIKKGISQEQLAKAVNLTQKSISNFETNITPLSLEYIIKFANYFNVSCDYLIKRIDSSSLLKELYNNISISYVSTQIGDNSYEVPKLSIGSDLFNYLIVSAKIENDKIMPRDIKSMWLERAIKKFYDDIKSNKQSFIELIPLPEQMIYPDDNKSDWKQSDLLREINVELMKTLKIED